MPIRTPLSVAVLALPLLAPAPAAAADAYEYRTIGPPRALTNAQAAQAAANYDRYCALCHGADREGYANDNAPSLKSKQLLQSAVPHGILRPLSYGRAGTAMGGYLDEVGGPLTIDETWDLTYWLFWQEDYDRLDLSENAVEGDHGRGAELFAQECSSCHGDEGQGGTAPAVANASALAHNKDEFIRFAISEGRDNTPMQAYKDKLSHQDINHLTAYLRSMADGGASDSPVLRALPTPDNYIINPDAEDPDFDLKDGMYVMAEDLYAAHRDNKRMVLLDTRVTSVWQRAHIRGAIPLPYYTDLDEVVADLPKDVMIVAYCSCPRAAADYIVNQLRGRGFKNAVTMYEGIFGWMNMGYPVMRGEGLGDDGQTGTAH